MRKSLLRRSWGGSLVFLGFWLSPLSPWNDAFTNVPLAYLFGSFFSFLYKPLFTPMAILGYWLTNIAGFILMHYGYVHLGRKRYSIKKHWKKYLIATTTYTALIFILIWYEILPTAEEIMELFK
jgi:hypothetical protein